MMKSPEIWKGLLEDVSELIYFPVYVESGRIPESGQKTLGNFPKRSKKSESDQKVRDWIHLHSLWILCQTTRIKSETCHMSSSGKRLTGISSGAPMPLPVGGFLPAKLTRSASKGRIREWFGCSNQ
jgi:hypothetical protein